jgi:hypothetical protein
MRPKRPKRPTLLDCCGDDSADPWAHLRAVQRANLTCHRQFGEMEHKEHLQQPLARRTQFHDRRRHHLTQRLWRQSPGLAIRMLPSDQR